MLGIKLTTQADSTKISQLIREITINCKAQLIAFGLNEENFKLQILILWKNQISVTQLHFFFFFPNKSQQQDS